MWLQNSAAPPAHTPVRALLARCPSPGTALPPVELHRSSGTAFLAVLMKLLFWG